MIILLEGPDGAGKTTLARKLNGYYVHQGPFQGDPFSETIATLRPLFEMNEDVVWDRSHLGEQVYGPIYRGVDTLPDAKRRMLDRWLLSHQAVVINCRPPYDTCLANWQERRDEEMLDDEHQLRAVYDAYGRLRTELPVVVHDYTFETPWSDLFLQLVESVPPENHGPGVGYFGRGVTLLVGDQCNVKTDEPNLPFIGSVGCSPWLADILEWYDVRETQLYWVNAYRPDGTKEDLSFINRLLPRRIIALGQRASTMLLAKNIDHEYVHHPSYWRRFHSRKRYPLIDLLRK